MGGGAGSMGEWWQRGGGVAAMRLIRSVEIERFRSLSKVRLDDLTDVVAVVGPNNGGKSNILRALNLFFNDETDPDSWLDFERDYHLAAGRQEEEEEEEEEEKKKKKKKKKSIRVGVEFEIPESFPKFFRTGLGEVRDYLGRRFWIRKRWTPRELDEPALEIRRPDSKWQPVEAQDVGKVRQFLSLVSFRYIPNRAVPAEVIRQEWRAIRDELARRVASYAKGEPDRQVRDELQRIAAGMVRPIASDLEKCCAGLGKLELATPEKLAEMLAPSLFRAAVDGLGEAGKVEDTSLGAGVQAVLMFQVLHGLVDSSSFRGFGWKQAAIWAVEEPESSLHKELQLHLAALLQSYAVGDDKRFQVISTTHSEVFVYGATSAFGVTQGASGTEVAREPVGELALKAANEAWTGWTHPALKFPFDTVVLVEGDIDRRVLTRGAQLLAKERSLMFCTPSDLDEAVRGDGVEAVKGFVGKHGRRLSTRLPEYPLLVVLDWDTSDGKTQETAKRYGPHGSRLVMKMDEARADERVKESFRGIERFYSHRLLELANKKDILPLARMDDRTLVVTPKELNQAKSKLADLFCEEATRADCRHLEHVIVWAENVSRGMLC